MSKGPLILAMVFYILMMGSLAQGLTAYIAALSVKMDNIDKDYE